MVVYFNKNPNFKKKKHSHKKFREILAHELVQPLFDAHASGELSEVGRGHKSTSQEDRLKGKHFRTTVVKRGGCSNCRYHKKKNGAYKDTKTYSFCEKCQKHICINCFKVYHTKSNLQVHQEK